jgi:hypothetical protein
MGEWQGAAMDSLKHHSGPPCPTLLRPAGGTPLEQVASGVAHSQGRRPTADFYPFGHPMPYAYEEDVNIGCGRQFINKRA